MSGDHFGSYGDPPSNSERATKRAIESLKGERNQIRQLETELAEARAEIEHKDKLIEQMRNVIENQICNSCTTMRCGICDVRAALAAEGGE